MQTKMCDTTTSLLPLQRTPRTRRHAIDPSMQVDDQRAILTLLTWVGVHQLAPPSPDISPS